MKSKTIHTQRYRRLKSKYQAFKKRLDRHYKNGSFFRFSKRKQQALLQRLQRYFQALQRLAAPAALFSASLLCSQALEAQTFTEVTDTNSPFIFIEGIDTDAPFGLVDVGNGAVPVFVDVDQDGDLDAFVGERQGNINYFENTSTDSSIPAFSLISSDNAFGLGNGYYVAPTVVDIDGDGDFDIFVGTYNDGISFYENTSNNSSIPAFTLSTASEPFGITNVGVLLIPTFVDIDKDGDFDAFVGEESGDINFFENIGDSTNPNFIQSTESEPFGITKLFRGSSPSFVDIDHDGDLDLFSRQGSNPLKQKIVFYENTSLNNSLPAFTQVDDSTPFGILYLDFGSVPVFTDVDKDGDFDLLTGESYGNIKYYRNEGSKEHPEFIPQSIDVRDYAAPAFGDLDKDGDLDMLVASGEQINFFENIGDNISPIFLDSESSTPFGLSELSKTAPVLVDIDKDGDLDLFSARSRQVKFFENTSSESSIPAYTLSSDTTPFGLISDRGSSITFVDIDNDGDLDAFIGEEINFNPKLLFFENTSTDSSISAFVKDSDNSPFDIVLEDFDYDPVAYFVDIDGDEDFDLFIGDGFGDLSYHENIGDEVNPSFQRSSETAPFNLELGGEAAVPAIIDLDNDGFYEAIIGERMGYLNYFKGDISTSLPKLEITDINTLKTEFCLNETETFAEVRLGNRGCDRNGNAIYTASVTPAGQGVSASVVGTGASDCSFIIELTALETAVAANYSINLTVEDADGVNNTSSTPEISNTGTVLFFNLGIVEVLNSEQVEVEPIAGMTIDNGTSEDIMVNINNTKATTTYQWMVAGVSLPILTGDDVDTGAAIPIDLGNGNIINVSASTESVVGDFTNSILTIDNPAGGAAQDFEVRLTATQECGPDTQSAIFTSGDFDCSDADLILGNRILPTDNYEAFNRITSESIIAPSSGVAFRAGTIIELKPNFHAQNGATFTAEIEDCTTETNEALEERQSIVTPSISSLQIAPNPTNGASQLQFQLAKAHPVVVEIYDARGTLTTTVLNGQLEKGIHQIALPTTDFSNGMYFVIVRTQDGNMVEKLMVLGE